MRRVGGGQLIGHLLQAVEAAEEGQVGPRQRAVLRRDQRRDGCRRGAARPAVATVASLSVSYQKGEGASMATVFSGRPSRSR